MSDFGKVLAKRRKEWTTARLAEPGEASRKAFANKGGALFAIMHSGPESDPEELLFQLLGYREWLTEQAARLVALECRHGVMPHEDGASRHELSMRQLRSSYFAALARAADRELVATQETVEKCREIIESDRARDGDCVLEWEREEWRPSA